jgi:hypothetical protein
MGVLGGLLLKKPLKYDSSLGGTSYREFGSLDDIQDTEHFLNDVIAFDDLFSLMRIDPQPVRGYGFLNYQNLILTLWANHLLGDRPDSTAPVPITQNQIKRLHQELFDSETAPRKITNTKRENFLGWLADRSGLADYAIGERLASALEALFGHLEEELGSIAAEDLDPRHIYLFLFQT